MENIERIICGDNLASLQSLDSESVDLCYIDPPFFSGRNYAVIWNDGAEIRQFEDRWVKMGENGKMSKDINVYLDWMEPRISEIHRILKKTGTFYLHCDWHADAYLRVMCDGIFGENNFNSSVYWVRTSNTGSSKAKSRKNPINTDTILIYNKSKEYTWNR